jgi:hypothetical protein
MFCGIDEYRDGSRSGRSSGDQSRFFERQDHSAHRRRRDAKEARDVGLRRRAPVYERIGVDEGEILTPSGAENLWRIPFRSIHHESSIFEGKR